MARTHDADLAAVAADRLDRFIHSAQMHGGAGIGQDHDGLYLQAVIIRPEIEDMLLIPMEVNGVDVEIIPVQ